MLEVMYNGQWVETRTRCYVASTKKSITVTNSGTYRSFAVSDATEIISVKLIAVSGRNVTEFKMTDVSFSNGNIVNYRLANPYNISDSHTGSYTQTFEVVYF